MLKLAQNKAEVIAKVTNRPVNQVKAAIAQGEKMAPNIFKNINDAESGGRFLENMGIDKSVLDEGFNKYSSYLSKIPGLNANTAKPLINMIKGAMRNNSRPAQAPIKSSGVSFDKSKYPRV